jgi:hypothetical protein
MSMCVCAEMCLHISIILYLCALQYVWLHVTVYTILHPPYIIFSSATICVPMIPLGLKETTEVDFRQAIKVSKYSG